MTSLPSFLGQRQRPAASDLANGLGAGGLALSRASPSPSRLALSRARRSASASVQGTRFQKSLSSLDPSGICRFSLHGLRKVKFEPGHDLPPSKELRSCLSEFCHRLGSDECGIGKTGSIRNIWTERLQFSGFCGAFLLEASRSAGESPPFFFKGKMGGSLMSAWPGLPCTGP